MTTASEKRNLRVFMFALALIALAITLSFVPARSGINKNSSTQEPLVSQPFTVQQIVTTNWFGLRGQRASIAKDITPMEDDVAWDVMFNDDPNQIIHMPPRNTPVPKHVVMPQTPIPTSVKIRVAPAQTKTSCLFVYELVPTN